MVGVNVDVGEDPLYIQGIWTKNSPAQAADTDVSVPKV
jgi:hypothetical protein